MKTDLKNKYIKAAEIIASLQHCFVCGALKDLKVDNTEFKHLFCPPNTYIDAPYWNSNLYYEDKEDRLARTIALLLLAEMRD